MFIEISKNIYDSLKPYLVDMGIQFEASDCTIPGENVQMIHLEVHQITEAEKEQINNALDSLYGKSATARDRDGNGLADYLEEEDEPQLILKRRRKWDERAHTLKEEAIGFITGKNVEEEVVYVKE